MTIDGDYDGDYFFKKYNIFEFGDSYVLHIIICGDYLATWQPFTALMAIIGDYRRLCLLAMAIATIAISRQCQANSGTGV